MRSLFSILLNKLKEAMTSVLPVAAIVLLLYFTPYTSLTGKELAVFLIATAFLVLGIGLFNLGADLAMTPMGEHVGAGLTKTRNIGLLLSICFGMGVLITVAEPDLSVLASQVKDMIQPNFLIVTVGLGVGMFLLLAVLKILFSKNLSALLMYFYFLLFALTSLIIMDGKTNFLAVAFDSGGVTTGPITVPFIMALGVGIASTVGGRHAGENSFGLISLCSAGPILAVLTLGLLARGEMTYQIPDYSVQAHLGAAFWPSVLTIAEEVAAALGLIVVFFILLQIFILKLPKKKLYQIGIGILYTFVGLVIFLCAVNVGFMPIGYKLGTELAQNHPVLVVVFGFVLGLVVVMAEPAVHVLNRQVEDVTSGAVSRRSMMTALSIGVGISIALSLLRIICDFNILYYLIPGYFLSLGLSFFVPPIYTAIAFDSGGVASGPLTYSFILPFAVGVCAIIGGADKILSNAFGIVAMVAMTPLITIQLLGFRSVVKRQVQRSIAMRRMRDADDEQIIEFL